MLFLYIVSLCIVILMSIWYVCALMFIFYELWRYDYGDYNKLGRWIYKIATFEFKRQKI